MTGWLRLGLMVGLVVGTAAGQDTGAVPARPTGPVRISGGVIAGQILKKVNPVATAWSRTYR
jgi:protein TonB